MSQPSNERWLPVVGYESLYEVSDRGRARRLYASKRGRYLARSIGTHGYVRYSLTKDRTTTMVYAHRMVMDAFVGPLPDGMVTRHLNGDPADSRLENLLYGTWSENSRDSVVHGTNVTALANLEKTHCPIGHVLAAPNLVESMLPRRKCKACDRSRKRVKYNPARVFEEDVAWQYQRIMSGETRKSPPLRVV